MGAARALEILAAEFDLSLAMLGATTPAALDRSYLLPGTVRGAG